jgi:iron-sulfur cluster assembly accessory protein
LTFQEISFTGQLKIKNAKLKIKIFALSFLIFDLSCCQSKMIANLASKSTSVPNFRVGDERLVKLTENAARKVSTLLTKQGRANGVLRVAVIGGGCSGLQYKMDLQDNPANRDILVESGGVRVVVDPKSALYVTGSELDYTDALQDGGFKVKNPNAATSCSCGESFSA